MTDNSADENDKAVASETVVSEITPDRRRLFRRLVTLAGLGVTGILLSQDGFLPKASAGPTNVTTGTTNTSGQLAFWDGAADITGSADLTWHSYGLRMASLAQTQLRIMTNSGTDLHTTIFMGNDVAPLGCEFTLDPSSTTHLDLLYQVGTAFGSTGRFYIDENGNVGIGNFLRGTLVPSSKLHCLTESATTKGIIAQGFSGQSADLQEWQDSSGNTLSAVDPQGYLTVGHSTLSSRTDGGILIQGMGNSLGWCDMGLRIKNTGIGGNEWYLDSTGTASGYGGGKLVFVSPPGSGTPTMTLTPDKVGIGTTSPARLVHLQGDNAVFRMDRDVDSAAFMLVRTAVGDFSTVWKTFVVGASASGVNNGSFFISDLGTAVAGAGTTRFVISNTGLVGVGRTPTTNQFEVEGTASKTAAGSWLANSDMHIKTDVEDIDDALATIRKLHPVRFCYTDSYRAKHPSIKDHPYYNFIAQEYREVFPDSVQDDGEGLLQMDSYNTTPYLVRAVQELTEQNEKLQERIANLERTVKQFTAR